MTATERVVQRLNRPRKIREGVYRADCPACGGDSGTKFSIKETDSGVVVHCFGGCPLESILAALGMRSAAELFDQVWKPDPGLKRQRRIERGLEIWAQDRLRQVCQDLRWIEADLDALSKVAVNLDNEDIAEAFRQLYWRRSELEGEWHVLLSGDLQRIYDESFRRAK
jgi:hypothetical protein